MKWILICVVAFIICFGISFLLSFIIFRKKKSKRALKITVSTIIVGLIFSLVCTFGYLGVYYKPKEDSLKAIEGNEIVNVTKLDTGYYFDGVGEDTALIFYPGAKVQCVAYAPIMLKMAEDGIDCFLVDMPFNFALFFENRCESFMNSYKYENYILSGHSMGGLVAANYTASHKEKVKGLALLAAYPSKAIAETTNFLSIYGSEDGCLEKDTYEKDKVNWPKNSIELLIEGGNHAQFGDYGNQSGDGQAKISKVSQWDITSSKIIEWRATWNN